MNSFYCFQWQNYGKPLQENVETNLILYRTMPCTPMGDLIFNYPTLSSAKKAADYLEAIFWQELNKSGFSVWSDPDNRAELARSMLSEAGLQP